MSGVQLDAVLAQVGAWGRYQARIYCWLLLPILCSALYNSQYIFTAAEVPFRCAVPECEAASSRTMDTAEWGAWAFPEGGGRCERLQPRGTGCTAESFHPNITIPCTSWVYQDYHESIVSKFDLGCVSWQRPLVGTVHSVGLFAALPLTGYISDRYGRKTALVLTAVAAGAMGLVRSFSVSFVMYLVMEFFDATLGSGVYSTGFILGIEMVGPSRRVLAGNLVSIFYALGEVLLALVAWGVPDWRKLTWFLYAPSLLFIFYYFIIEESVRWLLSKGDKTNAARIIFNAAATNRKKLSPEIIKQLTVELEENVERTGKKERNVSCREVIRSRILMTRLAVCSFCWMTVTLIYYGLSINSVSLAGSRHLNYALSALVELPGYTGSVLVLDRFGRKISIITAFFICAISLIALPFVPYSLVWVSTCLSLVGKLCISMVFSSIYIYTSELFPTSVRHRLLGTCSMCGRVGNVVAPLTPLLMSTMVSLPYLLFGVLAAVSGLLMLLTPETLRAPLPDTVKQAEQLSASPHPPPPH